MRFLLALWMSWFGIQALLIFMCDCEVVFIIVSFNKMSRSSEGDQDYSQYVFNIENNYLTESSIKEEENQKSFSEAQERLQQGPKTPKRQKKNLENSEIAGLHTKKANLLQFIQLIGDHSTQPIRQDILAHCQKVSIHIPSTLSRDTVMKLVKNRVEKMIKNKRIKKNWSQEDLKILVWVVSKYCQYHGISAVKESMTEADWNNIANLIPGVTGKSCMFKWLSLKKNNLADNSWVEEESLLLDQMVKKYGENNWCRVSEELYLKNPLPNKIYRCPKQCREHWNCYLNPILKKGPWDRNQDYLLVRAVMELEGVKKWAQIVKMFKGRTENALKNRFNLIVQKQMKEAKKLRKPSQLEMITAYLKKHENQFQVDEITLQFLSQKRNHYSSIQAKKQPKKKLKSKEKKEEKEMASEQEEQEYIPQDGHWTVQGERRSRGRLAREFEEKEDEEKKEEYYCKNESIIASILSGRKNDPIFEYDQDSIKLEQKYQKPHSPPTQSHLPQPQPSPSPSKAQRIFQIEPGNVFFVPFSDEVISKWRAHSLIACRITEFNQIVEFSLPQQR